MPADLSGNKDNVQGPASGQESVTDKTQSPLEASSAQDAPLEPPKDAANPPPAVAPGGQGGAAETQGGEQSAAVPDTEEFLKSILGDNPDQGAQTPASPPVAPAEPGTPPSAPPPVVESKPETPPAPPTLETPAIPPAPPQEPQTPQGPAIKDSTSDLDDILKGDSSTPSSQPGADANVQGVGGGKPISQDIVSSMSQTPAPSKMPLKLIGLIVLAAVIAIGGYFAYTTFVSPSSTSKSTSSTTDLTSPSPVTETAVTADETRKTDLTNLQTALKNYYAGTGSYPVSQSLILLGEEDNVLTNELVTAQKLIDKIPLDPEYPTRKYGYVSDGKTFTLSAVLDDSADPGVVVEGGLNLYKVTPETVTTGSTSSEPSTEVSDSTASPTGDESVSSEGLNL